MLTNIDLSPHIPFISSIVVLLLVVCILYIRKWVLSLKRYVQVKDLQIRYFDFILKQNPKINAGGKELKKNFTMKQLKVLGFTDEDINQIDKTT